MSCERPHSAIPTVLSSTIKRRLSSFVRLLSPSFVCNESFLNPSVYINVRLSRAKIRRMGSLCSCTSLISRCTPQRALLLQVKAVPTVRVLPSSLLISRSPHSASDQPVRLQRGEFRTNLRCVILAAEFDFGAVAIARNLFLRSALHFRFSSIFTSSSFMSAIEVGDAAMGFSGQVSAED